MAEFLIEVTEQEVGIVIGLHDHEKTAPQRVVISVQVLTRDVTGRADDHVDYDAIVHHIRSYQGARVETQEDLVLALHGFVMALPNVQAARICSRKPDIFADCAWVGLCYPARPLFG
ncbi:dihydroneopterin aldolase [Gemmobacter sp.]|uniref:dihydroneopterin aldolase n=1 Tax=Gemmobacter sp. TaxID=1898957 RepID=UPI002AFFD2B6|nr:dihydroneopterin aldolase [Gemmobacter sp.]